MYALKNLLGVLSGKKAPRGGGTFFPATPQVLYSGIHFCRGSVYATSSVVRCNATLDDLSAWHPRVCSPGVLP